MDESIFTQSVWNRSYPSDMKPEYDPPSNGMRVKRTEDIVGQTHEKITVEVWGHEIIQAAET